MVGVEPLTQLSLIPLLTTSLRQMNRAIKLSRIKYPRMVSQTHQLIVKFKPTPHNQIHRARIKHSKVLRSTKLLLLLVHQTPVHLNLTKPKQHNLLQRLHLKTNLQMRLTKLKMLNLNSRLVVTLMNILALLLPSSHCLRIQRAASPHAWQTVGTYHQR